MSTSERKSKHPPTLNLARRTFTRFARDVALRYSPHFWGGLVGTLKPCLERCPPQEGRTVNPSPPGLEQRISTCPAVDGDGK